MGLDIKTGAPAFVIAQFRRIFLLQVQIERTTTRNIEHLHAAAYAQNGHLATVRFGNRRQFHRVTRGIQEQIADRVGCAEVLGCNVFTACQEQTVTAIENPRQSIGRTFIRDK